MKDLLEKISSYNIFNYLLPGVLFAFIISKMTVYSLLQDDILTGAFVYYFLGLTVSRVGSLLIDPLLKKVKFVRFSDYKTFVSTSKKDGKIELLSEVNNMYRTLCALFLLILVLLGCQSVLVHVQWLVPAGPYIALTLLALLFAFSYRKQSEYVVKRIDANKDPQ
jgi:hypothetical protein